jgi:hypothetical protein
VVSVAAIKGTGSKIRSAFSPPASFCWINKRESRTYLMARCSLEFGGDSPYRFLRTTSAEDTNFVRVCSDRKNQCEQK